MIDDFGLIVSSFQTQYGIRLSKELAGMKWDEFRDLLVGIGPETPLGRMVSIRAENDKEILKRFTKDQKRIRSEWMTRQAKTLTEKEMSDALGGIRAAFIAMAGGVENCKSRTS